MIVDVVVVDVRKATVVGIATVEAVRLTLDSYLLPSLTPHLDFSRSCILFRSSLPTSPLGADKEYLTLLPSTCEP